MLCLDFLSLANPYVWVKFARGPAACLRGDSRRCRTGQWPPGQRDKPLVDLRQSLARTSSRQEI